MAKVPQLEATRKRSNISREIISTLPSEIDLLRTFHYHVKVGENQPPVGVLVVRVVVPPNKEEALLSWKETFEANHPNLNVLLDRPRIFIGLKQQLEKLSAGEPLLTNRHVPMINFILNNFHGKVPIPEESIDQSKRPQNLKDSSAQPFITVDSKDTTDREDALFAMRNSPSRLQLKVAFVDVSWFITPGDDVDTYGRKAGSSLWGKNTKIPMLGEGIAAGEASFVTGETRPAWVVTLDIRSDGRMENAGVSRELVKAHRHITPERFTTIMGGEQADLENSANGRATLASMDALSEISKLLQKNRLNRRGIIRVKDASSDGNLVVQECMVAAKAALAEFFCNPDPKHHAPAIPAIFKVHAPPTKEEIDRFVERINGLALPDLQVSESDLTRAAAFTNVVRKLEQAGMYALVEEILHTLLMRSNYSTTNKGHSGLGVEAYAEIKPRWSVGIVNQLKLRQVFDGCEELISPNEIESRANTLNRQLRKMDQRIFRLRFLEGLVERLESVGQEFSGRISEIKEGKVYVQVHPFLRWGLVDLPDDSVAGKFFEVGEHVKLTYRGFNPQMMRDQFEVIPPSLAVN